MERGFINPAAEKVLRQVKDPKKIQGGFWEKSLIEIAEIILKRVKIVRKNTWVRDYKKARLNIKMLNEPEKAVIKAIEEQKKSLEFIEKYKIA